MKNPLLLRVVSARLRATTAPEPNELLCSVFFAAVSLSPSLCPARRRPVAAAPAPAVLHTHFPQSHWVDCHGVRARAHVPPRPSPVGDSSCYGLPTRFCAPTGARPPSAPLPPALSRTFTCGAFSVAGCGACRLVGRAAPSQRSVLMGVRLLAVATVAAALLALPHTAAQCASGWTYYSDNGSEGRDSCLQIVWSYVPWTSSNDSCPSGTHLLTFRSSGGSPNAPIVALAYTLGTDTFWVGCSQAWRSSADNRGWGWVDGTDDSNLNCGSPGSSGCGVWRASSNEPKCAPRPGVAFWIAWRVSQCRDPSQ